LTRIPHLNPCLPAGRGRLPLLLKREEKTEKLGEGFGGYNMVVFRRAQRIKIVVPEFIEGLRYCIPSTSSGNNIYSYA